MSYSRETCQAQPGNVLLIITDQQHADTLQLAHEASAGNPFIHTPNLDRLAQSGARLTQHCTPCALCTPARASMMTGLYPRSHGAWHVGTTLDRNIPTIADILSEVNYACSFFGKCHLEAEKTGFADNLDPDEPYYGFHPHALAEDAAHGPWWQWICREHPEFREAALRTLHEAYQNPPLKKHGGKLAAAYTSDLPEQLSHSHWITDRTLESLDKAAESDQPFLTVCSYIDPHHPWVPVGKWATMYKPEDMPTPAAWEHGPPDLCRNDYCFERNLPLSEYQRMMALYYGMISHIDDNVGRLLDRLDKHGMAENTTILFTSDHGDHIGNRQLIRKSGLLTWDLMNVPMLIRGPGIRPGSVIEQPSQHEDVLPTLLDFLSIPDANIPSNLSGHSFAQSLQGASPWPRNYHYLVHDTPRGQHWAISDGRRKLSTFPATAKHQRRWRYITLAENSQEIEADTSEVPENAQDLHQALGEWLIHTPEYRAEKPARW